MLLVRREGGEEEEGGGGNTHKRQTNEEEETEEEMLEQSLDQHKQTQTRKQKDSGAESFNWCGAPVLEERGKGGPDSVSFVYTVTIKPARVVTK